METPSYREHELALRTQDAELKERTLAARALLPGTPGSLALRAGTGYGYWYRVFYPVPGKAREELVCKDGDVVALEARRGRMAFGEWAAVQVSSLRKLGFQVADKATASVLVELHNRQAFEAGLVLTGTLACMAWLNELGAIAITARTLDIELARRQKLKLGAPLPFLTTMQATGLPFVAVPGLPSTSVKLPGLQGLRVDLLAPGRKLGRKPCASSGTSCIRARKGPVRRKRRQRTGSRPCFLAPYSPYRSPCHSTGVQEGPFCPGCADQAAAKHSGRFCAQASGSRRCAARMLRWLR